MQKEWASNPAKDCTGRDSNLSAGDHAYQESGWWATYRWKTKWDWRARRNRRHRRKSLSKQVIDVCTYIRTLTSPLRKLYALKKKLVSCNKTNPHTQLILLLLNRPAYIHIFTRFRIIYQHILVNWIECAGTWLMQANDSDMRVSFFLSVSN